MANIAADALREHIMATYQLEPEVVEDFMAVWQPTTAGRKYALTHASDIEKCLYCVQTGVQRIPGHRRDELQLAAQSGEDLKRW